MSAEDRVGGGGVAGSAAAPPPGSRPPAETAPHACSVVAWPTSTRRDTLWRGALDAARAEYAAVVGAIARFEAVLLVADPADAASARAACGEVAEVVELPIDDSWIRDSGPIVVRDPSGERRAVCFRFNSWGGKYLPYARDAEVAARLAGHLGLPRHEAPIVLEGGALAHDGDGLFVTTERCLLNPNRNPGLSRAEIDEVLATWLGARRVVWLADAIAEDAGTDGHVDNVVAFFAPGRALLQGCDDPANPNAAIAADNAARLAAAGVEVETIPALPYATGPDGSAVPVPYVNLYPVNGGVVVPVTGAPTDAGALATVERCYPGREVVGVPGALLAYGGGGVHCITQQVPA